MKLEKLLSKISNFLTVQKGKPYFFPNCKNENLINKTNLQYKLEFLQIRIQSKLITNRSISLNYKSFAKKRNLDFKYFTKKLVNGKLEFSKLF